MVLSLFATVASAADPAGRVTGRVAVTANGAPATDASGIVVYLVGFEAEPPATPARLVQKGHRFAPELLPAVVGQVVEFPNLDWDTSHNVFSHDPRFNLGQYRAGRGAAPTMTFGVPGPVEIFCDIHPEMAATVLVLPNRSFATTSADGTFTIEGVPAGTWDLFAYDRHAVEPARTQVTLAGAASVTVALAIERTRFDFAHPTWDGHDYAERSYGEAPLPPPPER